MHLLALINAAIEVVDSLLWVWYFARQDLFLTALRTYRLARHESDGILTYFHDTVIADELLDKWRQTR